MTVLPPIPLPIQAVRTVTLAVKASGGRSLDQAFRILRQMVTSGVTEREEIRSLIECATILESRLGPWLLYKPGRFSSPQIIQVLEDALPLMVVADAMAKTSFERAIENLLHAARPYGARGDAWNFMMNRQALWRTAGLSQSVVLHALLLEAKFAEGTHTLRQKDAFEAGFAWSITNALKVSGDEAGLGM